jgi:hypothetical protein
LVLKRVGRPPIRIRLFERDVDIYCHANSRYVAVTDWQVSKAADCFLYDVRHPWKAASISAALPPVPESGANSHFYVTCDSWQTTRG